MTKVRIEMDEGWRWWPVTEAKRDSIEIAMGLAPDLARQLREPMTMEVDQELIDRYEAAYAAMRPLQEALENLYRIQQGIKPWDDQPTPNHTLLEKTSD